MTSPVDPLAQTAELSARRPIAAPGPAADTAALRHAYLGLLKLGVCDLIATRTTSVRGLPGGGIVSRELEGEELLLRAAGGDWPLHGLTMTGLPRLDDLQACVETLVREEIAGDVIETGSWRGGSSLLIRATLDSLGACERTVWVADSFAGFPAPDDAARPPDYAQTLAPFFSAFQFLAIDVEEVEATFSRLGLRQGTRLLPGFFEETLPGLFGHPWSMIRLDGDTYAATTVALEALYPGLARGGYVIVDDYADIEECRVAVDQFRIKHEISEPIHHVDASCVRWRRETTAFEHAGSPPEVPANPPRRQNHNRNEAQHVPNAHELALQASLEHLQSDLEEAQKEIVRMRQEVESVTSSHSWKITKPFRELRRLRSPPIELSSSPSAADECHQPPNRSGIEAVAQTKAVVRN